MTETTQVRLTINGRDTGVREVPVDLTLLEFLHDELNLTGSKFCCGIAVCRACTVSVRKSGGAPPNPVTSCSTPVASVNGQVVETVEGLAGPAGPNPLQAAFLKHFAFQCGYCTPGFLMAATILMQRLEQSPVSEAQLDQAIADALGAHICRCTGYVRYYQAVRELIENTPGLIR